MSDGDGAFSPDLPLVSPERPAPRPGPALLEGVKHLGPVRTRSPGRTFLFVAAAACAYPLYAFSQFPLRKDLPALPLAWFLSVGLLWLAAAIVPLLLALLPERGQVLPNQGRARVAAIFAVVVLTAAGLLTIDAPGHTIMPATTWAGFSHAWWHCISFSAHIVLPTMLAGALVMARVMLAGAARVGAAIGAAGGALSGLTLHALCPFGGALHVVTSHVGAVAIGAVLGAILFPLVRRATSALSS
jgi:hypothetical protein